MHKFTINRKTWLRGEGGSPSRLLRPGDGKMCCLGFYLQHAGLSSQQMLNKQSPACVAGLPEAARWLTDDGMDSGISSDGARLMTVNDMFTSLNREAEISALFAKHGIEVSFTDGEP